MININIIKRLRMKSFKQLFEKANSKYENLQEIIEEAIESYGWKNYYNVEVLNDIFYINVDAAQQGTFQGVNAKKEYEKIKKEVIQNINDLDEEGIEDLADDCITDMNNYKKELFEIWEDTFEIEKNMSMEFSYNITKNEVDKYFDYEADSGYLCGEMYNYIDWSGGESSIVYDQWKNFYKHANKVLKHARKEGRI
jgi:hypothetical protein